MISVVPLLAVLLLAGVSNADEAELSERQLEAEDEVPSQSTMRSEEPLSEAALADMRMESLESMVQEYRAEQMGLQAELNTVNSILDKENRGFRMTWTEEHKQKVDRLLNEQARLVAEIRGMEAKAMALMRHLKPLYGVLSTYHIEEQKRKMHDAVGLSARVAVEQSIFDALLRDDVSSSLTAFLFNFLANLVFGYIIGAFYYAFTAPFLIYEYCSSWMDIPLFFMMWGVCVVCYLTPVLLLMGAVVVWAQYERRRQATGHRRIMS
eukprot:Sspe_Gene.112376::Locus_95361_Transcript_1_1_Confidence_1.000_Length_861::g.112376::m.112376